MVNFLAHVLTLIATFNASSQLGGFLGNEPLLVEIPTLTEFKFILSKISGAFLGVIGKNEFRLYLEIDSTNFGVPIVNFNYIQHSRLNGICFIAFRELLKMVLH